MSIYYMFENHTFLRLDHTPVDVALDKIEQCLERDGGYGFIGCKGDHGDEVFQWKPGQPWRKKVEEILSTPAFVGNNDRRKGERRKNKNPA